MELRDQEYRLYILYATSTFVHTVSCVNHSHFLPLVGLSQGPFGSSGLQPWLVGLGETTAQTAICIPVKAEYTYCMEEQQTL